MATLRTDHKTLRQARKRVGSVSFSTFIVVLLRIAAGMFEGFQGLTIASQEEERKIVEKGLGLIRASQDHIVGTEPWLTGDLEAQLITLSQLLAAHPWQTILAQMNDDDLSQARDEVRLLLTAVADFSSKVEEVYGHGAFGLGAIGRAFCEMGSRHQALLLLLWHTLRSGGLGGRMDLLCSTAQEWLQHGSIASTALQQIRREIPAAAELLSTEQWRVALRSEQALERFHDQLRDLYQQHQEEFNTFGRDHPELQSCLQ